MKPISDLDRSRAFALLENLKGKSIEDQVALVTVERRATAREAYEDAAKTVAPWNDDAGAHLDRVVLARMAEVVTDA